MARRRGLITIDTRPARARLAWLLAFVILIQSLVPTLPADAGVSNSGTWIEICSADGHTLARLPADSPPVSGDSQNPHCALCWGFGPVATLPWMVAVPVPVEHAAADGAGLVRQTVYPPALFLSDLKSRAPPVSA
ncbi:conserved hypothetical protein [uncultured Gammaproteobacteria bacterium]